MELTEAIIDHARERFIAALNQHATRVMVVEVKLGDVNGPRGGRDKTCDVIVRLFPSATVIVKEQGDDLYTTISQAADRVKNSVGRKIDRMKENRT